MAFIIALILAIVVIRFSWNAEKEKINALSELQNQTKDTITYDDRTGVVTISQRHSSFRTRFTYEKYVATHYNYTPEKLVFTSATVGGVTTGGVDQVGGYGTKERHTDRYQIIYEYVLSEGSPKQGHVKEIRLSNELAEKARNSKVKTNY